MSVTVPLTLNSPAYERILSSVFHLMLVMIFSWTSFKVKVEVICRILKHGR